MGLFDFWRKKPQTRSIKLVNGDDFAEFIGSGYTTMAENAEVVSGCFRIAQLISSMTIYLMANTEKGDIRVVNELSRKIDIEPCKTMTRSAWMTAVVMNLLLYGQGNSVVYPHTKSGLLDSLEPIEARRISYSEIVGRADYRILIDGVPHDPANLLHFTLNPDAQHLWHGLGFRAQLKPIVDNLGQAAATERAFMSSKWKPSIIVKVDGLVDEFSTPEGRQKLLESYIQSGKQGDPWIIPAEQFSVDQVRPLSLADLAINDSVQLDKRTVAAVLGVPAFVLGVGDYNAAEWDSFINNTVRPIAENIEQELTRKLILSPKMYLRFNMSRLYSYDLQKLANVYGTLYDKGIVSGNEVRDKLGMQPREGLDTLIVLENYIPITDVGKQQKLRE